MSSNLTLSAIRLNMEIERSPNQLLSQVPAAQTKRWLHSLIMAVSQLAKSQIVAVTVSVAVGVGVWMLVSPGLGYRYLWQDEIETAERARTILESGLPRIVDAAGNVSINTNGKELDAGTTHWYTPWGQFYAAAAGLKLAPAFGYSKDASVRLPFVLSHALSSSWVCWAMFQYLGAPLPIAAIAGLGFGTQTVRILHARTARYHALIEIFTLLGLWALAIRKRRKLSLVMYFSAILVLPQLHTLGGSVAAAALSIVFLLRELTNDWVSGIDLKSWQTYRKIFFFFVLPWLATFACVAWFLGVGTSQVGWVPTQNPLQSPYSILWDVSGILYAQAFSLLCLVLMLLFRKPKFALFIAFWNLIILGLVFPLTKVQFTSPRYFMAIASLWVFWPIAFGVLRPSFTKKQWAALVLLLALVQWVPDFLGKNLVEVNGFEMGFKPFHGLRLASHDSQKQDEGARQILPQILDEIREKGQVGQSVLVNYVPQYVNWYLPGFRVVSAPDRSTVTPRNARNPAWNRTFELPEWHVWIEGSPGPLGCEGPCDMGAKILSRSAYYLYSFRGKQVAKYCIQRVEEMAVWENSPFFMRGVIGKLPEATLAPVLLSRRCD